MSPERAFVWLMVASLVGLGIVLSPFLYAFAIAAAIAVVTWPMHAALQRRLRDRRSLSAGIMTIAALLLIAIPITSVIALAVAEAVRLAELAIDFLSTGGLERWASSIEAAYGRIRRVGELSELLPETERFLDTLVDTVEDLLLDFTRTVSSGVPQMLGALGRLGMDLLVFCIALFTCYLRGPDMLQAVRDLSPLRPEYDDRLFQVFGQLATNVALGIVATSAAQGVISGVGFWLADAPAVIVLGLLTALASLVPVFGSALVFVPVIVAMALQGRWAAATFLLVWSVGLTASVDNVIRPLVFRSQLQVSPLPMLLSLLGGLLVFGPRGLVLGPFVLVAWQTLYTLYVRDFVRPAATASGSRPLAPDRSPASRPPRPPPPPPASPPRAAPGRARSPPRSLSPAPTALTGSTSGAGTCSVPSRVASTAPRSARETTTTRTRRSSHRRRAAARTPSRSWRRSPTSSPSSWALGLTRNTPASSTAASGGPWVSTTVRQRTEADARA